MRAVAMLFLAGALVDCGGGDGGGRDTGDPPAPAAEAAETGGDEAASGKSGCDLLTDAEVGEATGTTIASHEESGLNGCRWRAQDGMQLMLDVYPGSSATCDAQKVLGTGREEVVSGLGDSALWKTGGSLVVCAPRAVIRFNLDNSKRSVPEDKEGLIKLAPLVLDRL